MATYPTGCDVEQSSEQLQFSDLPGLRCGVPCPGVEELNRVVVNCIQEAGRKLLPKEVPGGCPPWGFSGLIVYPLRTISVPML